MIVHDKRTLVAVWLLFAAASASSGVRAAGQGDARARAEAAVAAAVVLEQQQTAESRRAAIQKYEDALLLWRQIGDRAQQASALHALGSAHEALSQYPPALAYYGEEISIRRALGDRAGEAVALHNTGVVHYYLGDYAAALDYYRQELPMRRAVADRNGEAYALGAMGLAHGSRGENQTALDYDNQALLLFQEVGNLRGEGVTLHNIGGVYYLSREPEKALEYLARALTIRRAAGDRAGEAQTISSIGNAYASMAEYEQALKYYGESLPLRRAVGDRRGESYTLDNIARTYGLSGDYQKALDYYDQVVPLRRAIGDRDGLAATLANVGMVYSALGDPNRAIEYFDQALALCRDVGNRRLEASTLESRGVAQVALADNASALASFQQALGLRQAINDRDGPAPALSHIGDVYAATGEPRKAIEAYEQALPLLHAAFARRSEAETLDHAGKAYAQLGEYQHALDSYERALILMRATVNRDGEAATLVDLARLERGRGRLVESRAHVEAALAIVESVRAKVGSLDLRASYLGRNRDAYDLDVDVLTRGPDDSPARVADGLLASERARARSLLDTLVDVRAEIHQGADPVLLERERSLQQQLNAKSARLARLADGPDANSLEHADALGKELASLVTEYQDVEARIRVTSPGYAALTQPTPLGLAGIQQQVLDADTVLLEYWLGAERSYVWTVTPSSATVHELPGRATIEAAARRVYDLVTSGRSTLRTQARLAATQLSDMILAPVVSLIGRKRLLIVPDGALQYVPFAMLPIPGRVSGASVSNAPLMITAHEIVTVPSASVLAALRMNRPGRPRADRTILVLADPVLQSTDPRVAVAIGQETGAAPRAIASGSGGSRALPRPVEQTGVASLERLRFSRDEAEAIAGLAGTEGSIRLDFDASRATMMGGDLGRYRFIHFATHTLVNGQHPELSGVVLSLVGRDGQPQDGFFRLHDIYNLRLAADLVVLSACQTALGKEVTSEGLIGLTRGFMYAGAPRVVASLWDVRDMATSELMKRFYAGILTQGLRPAAALRAAQLSLLADLRWQDPYYWAAFALQGEWR